MKKAESTVPIAVSQAARRWSFGEMRPQPKIHTPMKVDSRKNAIRPSIASGARRCPDIARVDRPVHAELELLHEARDDADRDEINMKRPQ